MLRLKRDVPFTTREDSKVVLPKGAAVMLVKGHGGGYAIRDAKMLADLTGDRHTYKHYHVWVKPEDVLD